MTFLPDQGRPPQLIPMTTALHGAQASQGGDLALQEQPQRWFPRARKEGGDQLRAVRKSTLKRLLPARGMARISFRGKALFVSADGPYERELIFEHLNLFARRYGEACLELARPARVVRACAGQNPVPCAGCSRHIDCVTYTIATHSFCTRCAKLAVR